MCLKDEWLGSRVDLRRQRLKDCNRPADSRQMFNRNLLSIVMMGWID